MVFIIDYNVQLTSGTLFNKQIKVKNKENELKRLYKEKDEYSLERRLNGICLDEHDRRGESIL